MIDCMMDAATTKAVAIPRRERFAAIDGRRLATPEQWRAGNGAWGCYRSHLLILEKCLLEGIDSCGLRR